MAKKQASSSVAPSRAGAGTVTDEMKQWAFVGILLPIIGYVLILITKKGGSYAEYYGKQGLVLGLTWVIFRIIAWVAAMVFWTGWMIMGMLWLLWVILWIVGIVFAFSGERKPLPVIGEFGNRF